MKWTKFEVVWRVAMMVTIGVLVVIHGQDAKEIRWLKVKVAEVELERDGLAEMLRWRMGMARTNEVPEVPKGAGLLNGESLRIYVDAIDPAFDRWLREQEAVHQAEERVEVERLETALRKVMGK